MLISLRVFCRQFLLSAAIPLNSHQYGFRFITKQFLYLLIREHRALFPFFQAGCCLLINIFQKLS